MAAAVQMVVVMEVERDGFKEIARGLHIHLLIRGCLRHAMAIPGCA